MSNRDTRDQMARRIYEHGQRQAKAGVGRTISKSEARTLATEAAKRHDRRKGN